MLQGFAIALAILAGMALLIWVEARRIFPHRYEISARGIRIFTFGLLFHEIPRDRIVGVRVQGTPGGYWSESSLSRLSLMDHPSAAEGVCVVCADGTEVVLSPPSPAAFVTAAAQAGIPTLSSTK